MLAFLVAILAVYAACGGGSDENARTGTETGDDDDDDGPPLNGDDDTPADDDATDDDATDDDATDDDAIDDDATDDDATDDDATDDDTGGEDYTCAGIADGSVNTCGRQLTDANGDLTGQQGMNDWCEASEAMFGGEKELTSLFWNCWGACIFEQSCDGACFSACEWPEGATEQCALTTREIFDCDVRFLIPGSEAYFIPLMDLQAFCGSLPWDWTCYAACVDTVACDQIPSTEQTEQLRACLGACDA